MSGKKQPLLFNLLQINNQPLELFMNQKQNIKRKKSILINFKFHVRNEKVVELILLLKQ